MLMKFCFQFLPPFTIRWQSVFYEISVITLLLMVGIALVYILENKNKMLRFFHLSVLFLYCFCAHCCVYPWLVNEGRYLKMTSVPYVTMNVYFSQCINLSLWWRGRKEFNLIYWSHLFLSFLSVREGLISCWIFCHYGWGGCSQPFSFTVLKFSFLQKF